MVYTFKILKTSLTTTTSTTTTTTVVIGAGSDKFLKTKMVNIDINKSPLLKNLSLLTLLYTYTKILLGLIYDSIDWNLKSVPKPHAFTSNVQTADFSWLAELLINLIKQYGSLISLEELDKYVDTKEFTTFISKELETLGNYLISTIIHSSINLSKYLSQIPLGVWDPITSSDSIPNISDINSKIDNIKINYPWYFEFNKPNYSSIISTLPDPKYIEKYYSDLINLNYGVLNLKTDFIMPITLGISTNIVVFMNNNVRDQLLSSLISTLNLNYNHELYRENIITLRDLFSFMREGIDYINPILMNYMDQYGLDYLNPENLNPLRAEIGPSSGETLRDINRILTTRHSLTALRAEILNIGTGAVLAGDLQSFGVNEFPLIEMDRNLIPLLRALNLDLLVESEGIIVRFV